MTEINGEYKIFNEYTGEYDKCYLETKGSIVKLADGSNVEMALSSLNAGNVGHLTDALPHFSINENGEKVKYAMCVDDGVPAIIYEIEG